MYVRITEHQGTNMDLKDFYEMLSKDELIVNGSVYGIISVNINKHHGAEVEVIRKR